MNIETLNAAHHPHHPTMVLGKLLPDLPADLYIPPNALEVVLEAFSGPLDLLLYLIKKENINILDIPVAQVTAQYMEYVELMQHLHLELAAEYLVMAAMLAEIKSKLLLPRPANIECEDDPRVELVRRLREYEQFKKAAQDLESLPRMQREIFPIAVVLPETSATTTRVLPRLELQELLAAFREVMSRASMYLHHRVNREGLSIRERMTQILSTLQAAHFTSFERMFKVEEGRLGVVVTFVAILELLHQNLIEIVQTETYGSIYLKTVGKLEN